MLSLTVFSVNYLFLVVLLVKLKKVEEKIFFWNDCLNLTNFQALVPEAQKIQAYPNS